MKTVCSESLRVHRGVVLWVLFLALFVTACRNDRKPSPPGAVDGGQVADAATMFDGGRGDGGQLDAGAPDVGGPDTATEDAGPPDTGSPVVVTRDAEVGCAVACQFTLQCVLRMSARDCIAGCAESLAGKTPDCLAAYEAAGRCGEGLLCVQLRSGTCDRELTGITDACE